MTVSTKVAELDGIRIVTSTGFAVGDDVSAVLESLPADRVNDAIQFVWELSTTSGAHAFGGWAFADYGTHLVHGIGARESSAAASAESGDPARRMTYRGAMISAGGVRFAVLAATLIALSGCSAPGAAPETPSASPTDPSPSAVPAVAGTIEISGTGVAVLDEGGEVLAENAYDTDIDLLVGMLTDAVGFEPTVKESGPEDCASGVLYTWTAGENSFIVRDLTTYAPEYPHLISTNAATLGGLDVVTSTGLTIGDDVSDLLPTLSPEAVVSDFDPPTSGYFVWEATSTVEAHGMTFAYGGQGMTDLAGVLMVIRAPGTPTSGFFC